MARLNGQEVDLWQLYSVVLEMGGSYKVNHHSQWDEVYDRMFRASVKEEDDRVTDSRRGVTGVNVSVALRQIYQRFLMPYERIHYSNFSHDAVDDDDDESRSNFTSNTNTSTSGGGKDPAASFVIHSALTPSHPPSKHTQQSDPLSRLFCALVSGLANEMEFGLRVVTMLVTSRQIDAIANLRLVDVLLESCALSVCHCHQDSEEQLRRICSSDSEQERGLSAKKCMCLNRFWSHKCKDDSIAALLLDDLPDDPSALPAHDPETEEKISERVKRIADLIRTITESIQEFQESDEESEPEVAPLRLMRFAGLMLSSDDSDFKALALDIICNINLIGSQSGDAESYATLLNFIVCHCISLIVDDNDSAVVWRSIRALAHAVASAADEPNCAFLQYMDDESLIGRLIELLTCQHDVTLLTAALEFCWTISDTRPRLLTKNCNKLNHLIKILINLLNCDVSTHFTPLALKNVRVCDLRSRVQVRHSMSQVATSQQQSAVSQPVIRPAPAMHTSSISTAASSNNSAIASESESFAVSWMKGIYESSSRSQSISISEMYTDYVRTSCKNGRKNVVSAQSFTQIISRTFPSVTITSTHVEGLVVRPSTPRKTQTPVQQLTSPILKAHLCAPPKTSPTSTLSATSLTTATAPSHTGVAATTTTLIKSLLANKLRSNSQSKSDAAAAAAAADTSSDPSAASNKSVTVVGPADSSVQPVSLSQIVSSQNIITSSPQSVLISTSTGTSAGMPGQAPQQFLLVRTIIQPGQNQSGMRLILPASVYSPQRPAAPQTVTVNGNGPSVSPPATGSVGQSNDILLKAVLGSGIGGETVPQTSDLPKNCAKSSPLLNVLLDKGKLPEACATTAVLTAGTTSATTAVTQSQQQHDRVYILTTGSPMKSVNHNESVPLKNGIATDVSNATKSKSMVANCTTEPPLTNGDISVNHEAESSGKKPLPQPVADLSPLKDMQKAVDDAPKLISKRPADETQTRTPVKKSRNGEASENPESTLKSVDKILPVNCVNGDIKIPPKSTTEKTADVTRANVIAPVTNPASQPALEYVCEWHECKR